jgi:hypothetical protein
MVIFKKMTKRNITETPDKWVILKIYDNYKVYGTWAGGYLGNDRWRLNSGITKVEQDDDFYYFYGYSGSIYRCHKKSYGVITSYGNEILNKILKQEGVTQLDDMDNWGKLNLN